MTNRHRPFTTSRSRSSLPLAYSNALPCWTESSGARIRDARARSDGLGGRKERRLAGGGGEGLAVVNANDLVARGKTEGGGYVMRSEDGWCEVDGGRSDHAPPLYDPDDEKL